MFSYAHYVFMYFAVLYVSDCVCVDVGLVRCMFAFAVLVSVLFRRHMIVYMCICFLSILRCELNRLYIYIVEPLLL